MELIFASQNENKIKEINQMLTSEIHVVGMREKGIQEDIVEDGISLEENALIKARYIYEKLGGNVFSEDTGLEVDHLNGEPGVHTARYAGEERDATKNMNLLLSNLSGSENRSARFRTVMALIYDGKECLFEGKVEGKISLEMSGNKGFGYDPIFIPDGYEETFADLDQEVKNKVSHRKRALEKLINFLTKKNQDV